MITDLWFYAAAIPAMLVLGVSKGGFTALGLLMVPIMSLAISPIQAAGITLPILVLSDLFALFLYRRVYDRQTLKIMLPGAVLGLAIGWLTASWVTEAEVRFLVGLISVLFAVSYFLGQKALTGKRAQSVVRGSFWGAVTGFTSFVSHSGGPPYQIYVAPLRLDPRVFAGTSVILFAVMNAIKLPPYFFLGQFDAANLWTAAVLLPFAIPSTFLGVWLVKRFDPKTFYGVIYATILLVGVYLIAASLYEILRTTV